MANPTVVAVNDTFRLFGDAVTTYDNLPPLTFTVEFDPMSGYSLRLTEPLRSGSEQVYGNHASRVRRITQSFKTMDRSLGVILSGDKGMGKSLMIRMVAEEMRYSHGIPTVIVRQNTPGIASFIDEIGEAVIVFDEFEKIFSTSGDEHAQSQFLSLFDGMSATKRLYILSVNELNRLSDYMQNRPGRFHYHMRFSYPGADMIRTYLQDQAPGVDDKEIDDVIAFSGRFDLSFDHLRAIAFELNLGEKFLDVVGDLNIKRSHGRGESATLAVVTDSGTKYTFTGYVDLFDDESMVVMYDHNMDLKATFRLLGATETSEGLVLDLGSVTVVNYDDEDSEPLSLESAVVRRKRTQFDFGTGGYHPQAL